ncbi:MAG: hypothetical protein M0R46_16915 [Candidatus Muirbacterium halophilum]|nr:hypothetical protein [Candidatus Muirbacterium halophilum]MCK9477599.1 hypothetical protein [Candidatus Muirbacterium halophilum]
MLKKTQLISLFIVSLLIFLTACGGGSSSTTDLNPIIAKLSGNLFESESLGAPKRATKIIDTITGQFLFGGITKDITMGSNGLFYVELKTLDLVQLVAASGIDISGEDVLGKNFSDLGNISAQDIIEKYSVRLKFVINGETANIALPPSVLEKNKTTVLPKLILKKVDGKFKYMVQNGEGTPIISNAGDFLDELNLQTKNYDTLVSALSNVDKTLISFIDNVNTTTDDITNAITPTASPTNTITRSNIESRAFYFENGDNVSIIGFGAIKTDITELDYVETFLHYDGSTYTPYKVEGTVEVVDGFLSKHIATVNDTVWDSVDSATKTLLGDTDEITGVEYYKATNDFGIYSYNDTTGNTNLWRVFQPSTLDDFKDGGFFAPGNVFISHDGNILEAIDSNSDSTSDKLVENGNPVGLSIDANNVITLGTNKIWRFAASPTNLISNPELLIFEYDGSGALTDFSKATITKKTPLTLNDDAISGKVYVAIIPGVIDNNYYTLYFKDNNKVDIKKYNEFNSISVSTTDINWTFGINKTIMLGAIPTIPELNNAYLLLTYKIDPDTTTASGYSLTAQFADNSGANTTKKTIIMREATAFAPADYNDKNFSITNQEDKLLAMLNFTDNKMYDNELDIWVEFTPTLATLSLGDSASLNYLNLNTLGSDINIFKLEKTSTGFIAAFVENGEIELLNIIETSTISVDVATNFYKTTFENTDPWDWISFEMYNLTETTDSTGTYTYTKFTPNAKTESSGTYAISDRDVVEERYTLTFTATSGAAPNAMRVDYTDMYGPMAAFEDMADNDDANVGWDCWLVSRVADTDKNKFVDTNSEDRSVIDIKNNLYYYWEQAIGGEETYTTVNITLGDIPGGNTLTESNGNITYFYSIGHFGFGNPSGPLVYFDATTGNYEYDDFNWDKSLDSLNDNSVLVDATYCAYFKDPRTGTGTPTWEELHLMTVLGTNITDLKYDSAEDTAIEEGTMTWTSVDDTLLQISVGGQTMNGVLTASNATNGEHTIKMISSDAIFYETVPVTENLISDNALNIILTEEDGTGTTGTIALSFAANKTLTGSIAGDWEVTNGVVKLTGNDAKEYYIYRLKKPVTGPAGFNFFIKIVNPDGTSSIERGTTTIN